LLYHFIPDLKDYPGSDAEEECSNDGFSHLELLIQYLEEAYQSTSELLTSLLSHRKISYNLLWAWFKPGTLVYMTCPSTGLPRCVRYSFGEEKKTARGIDCFEINGHYFDFDGEVFGESTETLQIEIFRGSRRIENLPAYPLEYHLDQEIRSRLVLSGQKFVSLMGCHHRQYQGSMFVPHKGQLMKHHVNSRVMVDAGLFRKVNPNYARLQIKKPQYMDIFGQVRESDSVDRVRSNGMDPSELREDDLAICSPTLLGFSLNEKIWGEV
jgi:hypothetical protein